MKYNCERCRRCGSGATELLGRLNGPLCQPCLEALSGTQKCTVWRWRAALVSMLLDALAEAERWGAIGLHRAAQARAGGLRRLEHWRGRSDELQRLARERRAARRATTRSWLTRTGR